MDESSQLVIRRLLNEFRTPQRDVLDMLNHLKPVDNGHELVRIGPNGDGGYLLPNDFDGIKYAFSPGVQHITGFEQQLWNDYKIGSFLLDGSIEAPTGDSPGMISFDKAWIGAYDHTDPTGVPTYSLNTWMTDKLQHYSVDTSDLILQIDVEGFEWESLLSISEDMLLKFRIIVCEFGPLHYMTHKQAYLWQKKVFDKLLNAFDVVHFHENNCCGKFEYYDGIEIPGLAEITFHRKDRRLRSEPLKQRSIYNSLNYECVKKNPPSI